MYLELKTDRLALENGDGSRRYARTGEIAEELLYLAEIL